MELLGLILIFFPSNIVISENDTINFIHYSAQFPHTVVFGPPAPLFEPVTQGGLLGYSHLLLPPTDKTVLSGKEQILSSGLMNKVDQNFMVNFGKAGTYNYYDILYPDMRGTVTVLGPEAKALGIVPSDPVTEDVATGLLMTSANALIPKIERTEAVYNTAPSSRLWTGGLCGCGGNNANNKKGGCQSRIWTVRMIGDPHTQASLQQFIPNDFKINCGDWIEFVNHDLATHNIMVNKTVIYVPVTQTLVLYPAQYIPTQNASYFLEQVLFLQVYFMQLMILIQIVLLHGQFNL